MLENTNMNMGDIESGTSDTLQEKKQPLENKGKELLQYLNEKQSTEILLLDLLRSKELSQKDYEDMLRKGQAAYQTFLKKLTENDQDILRQ